MILINFGKYDDAIYCYKAISINSHLANAYYNKYVALSNVERYSDADKYIKISKRIELNNDTNLI
jgi:hypothetical protein